MSPCPAGQPRLPAQGPPPHGPRLRRRGPRRCAPEPDPHPMHAPAPLDAAAVTRRTTTWGQLPPYSAGPTPRHAALCAPPWVTLTGCMSPPTACVRVTVTLAALWPAKERLVGRVSPQGPQLAAAGPCQGCPWPPMHQMTLARVHFHGKGSVPHPPPPQLQACINAHSALTACSRKW